MVSWHPPLDDRIIVLDNPEKREEGSVESGNTGWRELRIHLGVRTPYIPANRRANVRVEFHFGRCSLL